MPSKDSKTPEKKDKNVVKFNANVEKSDTTAKKKPTITVSKIISYIILGLITIAMVGGVALSSFSPSGNPSSLVFGSYDGTPIVFAYGNYFYNQYQNLARQNTGTGESAAYQIWRGAFESTVFQTAMTQKAKAAGIRVADKTLNKAIIDSGIYDKDGKFDITTYEKASVESKKQVQKQYAENLPVQMVMEDVVSVLSTPAELDYIIKMGDNARSFEYVVFDSSAYPEELTRQYAQANPSLFTLLDISVISMEDQDRAEAVRDSIVAGVTTFEEAAKEYSLDSFASEGGRAGMWYFYELEGNFANPEEVNILFSTPQGSLSPVFTAQNGVTLYRVEQSPFQADLSDPEVLQDVRAYIGSRDAEIVTTYLAQQADDFVAATQAGADFNATAQEKGVPVISVEATPPNVGSSQYLAGFTYTDEAGYLSALSNDTAAMKSLYGSPIGSVVEPLATNNAFVVAKVTGESSLPDDMSDYLRLVYPYMAQSQSQQDLIQAIFTSDKFEDKFFETYLGKIMNVTAQ